MGFCTAVNCMDGRVQLPVIDYLRKRFGVEHVDTITEAGSNLILATRADAGLVQGILRRVSVSIEKHRSVGIAVVGHENCAGNPAPYSDQLAHIRSSVELLRSRYEDTKVIGLWVDGDWRVQEWFRTRRRAARKPPHPRCGPNVLRGPVAVWEACAEPAGLAR